ncbi:TonB-dependent receptor [Flavobacterium columnare]|uniref:TonB-dependent receptor n=1 Tax=Flavobacterium columnare TaxID=996 RepID=A0A437UBG9_9FLAO|nr:outer membrane beta-barrel family protein [Flavobacterium columnare]RVU90949.1 TonB-dependent receptor [Flavobacterium columnare]
MKKLKINLLFVFALVPLLIQAQFTVTGKVVGQNNLPIPTAEVSLLTNTNVIVTSQLTDEQGSFKLTANQGNYILQVKQLGTTLIEKNITVTQNLNLGKLQPDDAKKLEEVTIVAKKKLIERKVDRLVFNVESSISATGGDALDALKVTPGIRVQNDVISMIGKSGMAVMVDDKIIPLSGDDLTNYLKSITADNIKSIEVITTPPAKYSAEGNSGLINIKLKKVKKDNWNASLGSTYLQRTYPAGFLQGSYNINKNKITFKSSFNTGKYIYRITEKHTTYFTTESWDEQSPRDIKGAFFNPKVGLDYEVTKKSTVGFQFSTSLVNQFFDETSTIKRTNQGALLSSVNSGSNQTLAPRTYVGNLNYTVKLDTIGKKLTVDLDYLGYNNTDKQNVESNEYDANNILISGANFKLNNTNGRKIESVSLKSDVELPLKWASFETGFRVSNSSTNNDLLTYNSQVIGGTQQNIFNYNETTEAIYFSGTKEFSSKWKTQIGLRGEFTQTIGKSISLNETNKNNYGKLFPTVYLSYSPNNNHTFSIKYSKRINRAGFFQLNPFKLYSNAYVYAEGNPMLLPYVTHNTEFNYGYKNIEVSVYYSYKDNVSDQVSIVNPTNYNTHYFWQNVLTTEQWGGNINYTFDKLKWWSMNTSFEYSYNNSHSDNPVLLRNVKGNQASFSINNDFNVKKDKTILFNLNYWYDFAGVDGLDRSTSMQSLSAALKFLLLSKKLTLTLAGNDILRTQKRISSSYSNGILIQHNNYYDNQSLRFSINYQFGNDKLKTKERKFGNEEDSKRIN